METTINCLPNEILINILSRISVYDRINCRQVCTRWQKLSQIYLSDVKAMNFGHHLRICCDSDHRVIDEKSLSLYYENKYKLLEETPLMQEILYLIPRLKSLHVYLRDSQTVHIIANHCKGIECLTLISYDYQVMSNAIPMITNFGQTLRHLKISDESRALSCPQLKELIPNMLSHCTELQILHLFRIELNVKTCRMLSHTIREISTQLGSDSLEALIESRICEILERLIVRNSFINAFRMRIICIAFANLKKLHIETYSDGHDFTPLTLIAQMTRLEHLDINFVPKLTHQICVDDELIEIFNGCRNLTTISLNNCLNVEITDWCLIQLSACCLNISDVHFWHFGCMARVTAEGIGSLARLHRLRYLALDAMDFLDDNSLTASAYNLLDLNPSVHYLSLFMTTLTRN